MTSDLPGSSSQQPFAHPQPAPVAPNPNQATSPPPPPTKQSLKTWAKWFKGPAKAQETPESEMDRTTPPSDGCIIEEAPDHGGFAEEVVEQVSLASPQPSAPQLQSWSPSPVSRNDFFRQSTSPPMLPSGIGRVRNTGIQTEVRPSRARPASVWGLFDFGKTEKRPVVENEEATESNTNTNVLSSQTQIKSHRQSHHFTLSRNAPALSVKLRAFDFFAFARKTKPKYEEAKQVVQIVEAPTGIFGVPLRQSITYANVAISLVDAEGKSYIYGYVPIVVAKCGVYLKEKATNVEGIFRLSGSEKRIKELRAVFDSPDRYGKGLDWAGYTVHDAANVLRRYLNQLPEPIVPLDLYDRFREPLKGHTMQAVGDTEGAQLPDNFDVNQAIRTYQQLITELPPLNRQLLLYILDLLAVFASKSDENRMTSNNLAAIFQPGMLSHPSHDMAPAEYRLSQDVLIFLIENQDHFLIGMRGTAADEQTVNEVQNGGTPPPGTPNTSGRSKNLGRSASNASAGADDVRKFGGVRRNVSVSSRHSRQSNGAPSPASPAYGTSLTSTPTSGVHRSNTVPSKRSPGLPSSRLQKNQQSPSANSGAFVTAQHNSQQSFTPAPHASNQSGPSNVAPAALAMGVSSLAPSSNPTSATSQERLIPEGSERHPDATTPTREKHGFFGRSPTVESEKKQPAKLRKKRIPGSSNPSARSSTQSLEQNLPVAASPATHPSRGSQDVVDHLPLQTIPSGTAPQGVVDPNQTVETPRQEHHSAMQHRPEEHQNSSDQTLKPVPSPTSSLHSHSSFNDLSQSDADHDAVAAAEQKEKRSRWRLSRRREDSQSMSTTFTPKKGLGLDSNAAASSTSIGSAARPGKSFTSDTLPVGTDPTLSGTHQQPSNESNSHVAGGEEKKGPIGWLKNKMREKREESREKEAEKERKKSPPASTERLAAPGFFPRGKSVDLKREEHPNRIVEEPATTTPQPRLQEPEPHAQPYPQPSAESQTDQNQHQ